MKSNLDEFIIISVTTQTVKQTPLALSPAQTPVAFTHQPLPAFHSRKKQQQSPPSLYSFMYIYMESAMNLFHKILSSMKQ